MPGRRVRCLLAVALLVASPRVTGAGPNVWTTRGPEGGRIDALAIDPGTPSTLYAGTNGDGIFRSTDAGAGWSAFSTGLTCGFVRTLAIDPTGTVLHAGTTCGIFDYEIVPRPGA